MKLTPCVSQIWLNNYDEIYASVDETLTRIKLILIFFVHQYYYIQILPDLFSNVMQ